MLSLTANAESSGDITQRDFYLNAVKAHSNLELFFPTNSLFFIGDSLIQNLDVSHIEPLAVNLGIAGDTTVGILSRIPKYKSVKKARAFVFEAGINDMGLGIANDDAIASNYKKIFKALPPKPIFLLALFPVNEAINHEFSEYNQRILIINSQLAALCKLTPRCTFIDLRPMLADKSGNFNPLLLRKNDAIHYNPQGALLITKALKKRLPLEPLKPYLNKSKSN